MWATDAPWHAAHGPHSSQSSAMKYASAFLTRTRRISLLVTFVLSLTMGVLPVPVHAEELSFWFACSGGKARAEGRTIDLRSYLNVNTVGMLTDDIEDLYCITPLKCVALGHCKASSPEQQAAADQLKQEIAAEELRLERERQAMAAQAERERELERQRAEEERRRTEAAERAERARLEKLVAADAERLRLSEAEAKRLVDAREQARKKMPAKAQEHCTIDYAAYTQTLDFTPIVPLQAKAQKDYAAVDRSKLCNGHPGTLDPLQCDQPADFFGAKFGSCKAVMRCPARQENKPCNHASAQ